jgi:hypothetical protein
VRSTALELNDRKKWLEMVWEQLWGPTELQDLWGREVG